MLGFAWSELLLIGAVALVVIGPKDLPKVMRTMGVWSKRLRVLAGDFQRHVDEMVRQAEFEEAKREAENAMDVGEIGRSVEEAAGAKELQRALDDVDSAPAAPANEPPPAPSAEPAPPAPEGAPNSVREAAP